MRLQKNRIDGTLIVILFIALFLISCEQLEPSAPSDSDVLDGPVEGLTHEQMARHLRGDMAFTDAVFTPETGLGPVFVATSCAGCHAGDGKGHPFTALFRYGQSDSTGNLYEGKGGPQWQHRAIPGYEPEILPSGVALTKLIAPAITGLGFLEAVTDADILAMADPADQNGDGISGVPNWISLPTYVTPSPSAVKQGGRHIGRFGKKAGAYDLLMQTAKAYNQDIGVVSIFEPIDPYSHQEADPEVSTQVLHDNVFYQRTLKVPPVRNADHPDVRGGKAVFERIGCDGCHKPELKTGASPIAALANKVFYPYTDLLLHDMGPGLDDGYTEGMASTSEWRTPPLWGIGLSKNAQGGQYYLLHDGRASSIGQAIELHGGEAAQSRDKFNSLTPGERQQLIKFLENL